MLQTNNRWAIDSLLGSREARLLFANIRPNGFLVSNGFQLLSLWHPGEIYPKLLRAVRGIIENAFYDPDDGYRIYRLKFSDINGFGKSLDEERDQFEETNALAIDVLDRISQLGSYDSTPRQRALSKHAFAIRMAYFDNSKRCHDVIPQVLLTRLDSAATEVLPRKEYEAYLTGLPLVTPAGMR